MAGYPCEFCKNPMISSDNASHFYGSHFHQSCFRMALEGLAKISRDLLPKVEEEPIEAIYNATGKLVYVVIMNPEATAATRPRRVFPTYDQAVTVAKKLAAETGQNFWVMSLMGSAKPTE